MSDIDTTDQKLVYEPRMSDSDALMWRIEKDPLLRSTITSVSLLDTNPDRDRLRHLFDRASRVIPRLRQRVVSRTYAITPPRWEVDPNFDLDYHLRFVHGGDRATLRDVLDLAQPVAMQGFDRARPLWETVVVEGLEDGRAAVVQKIHHSITDGVGGIRLQLELLDFERDPEGAPETLPPAPESETLGSLTRSLNALAYESRRQMKNGRVAVGALGQTARDAVSDPVGVARRSMSMLGSTVRLLRPSPTPESPVMTSRSLSVAFETLTLGLGELKAAAHQVQGRMNDAYVAGVVGGLRRYHERHGSQVHELRMTMPISIRDSSTENLAGNQFVPARFSVPLDISDPLALMTRVQRLIESERNEPALALTEPIAGLLNRLPTSAATALFGSMLKGNDFVTTNVPGVPFPVYLAGAKAEAQFAFAPMTGSAVNMALLSYEDDVHIGINIDPAAIPDTDVLLDCLRDSFDEITKLA